MKRAKWLLAVAFCLFNFGFSSAGIAGVNVLGGEDPYPLEFPWSTIEGVWRTKANGYAQRPIYFSFEVREPGDGRKFLRILEIDPEHASVLSKGAGFAWEKDGNLVGAAMSGSNSSYLLYIGRYQNKDPRKKPVITLTMQTFGGELIYESEIVKISKLPVVESDENKCPIR